MITPKTSYRIVLGSLLSVLALTASAASETHAGATQVEQLAKTPVSWNGSPLPNYPNGTPEVTILRITIPPHTALPVHKHPVINAGVLLSGELTVVSENNETLRMKAGDSIVELVNQWHHGVNEGDDPAVILVFYAGEIDTPITIVRQENG